MRDKTIKFQKNASMIGLNNNIKKSKVIISEPTVIESNRTHLACTSSFTYLDSIVISEGGADKDSKARIGRPRTAF